MSFTGQFTAFIKVDENKTPKILDHEAWVEWQEQHSLADAAVVGKREEGDYPTTTYKTLSGFKQYGDDYELNNIAIQRDTEKFFQFLREIREFLETPFYFYHAERNYWPRLDYETVFRTAEEDRTMGGVYRVTVTDDDITVEHADISMGDFEEVDVDG